MTTDPSLVKETLQEAEEHMKKTIAAFEMDLRAFRTGRASPAIVEHVKVNYYDTPTPLQNLATITVPEAQMLMIRPFDAHSLKDIERAITASDLGITPNNDGKVIRLVFPRLSEERRTQLVKQVHTRLEEGRVSIRNIRRDAQNMMRDFEKEKMISEDDHKRGQDELQKLTDKYIEQAEAISKRKEEEIREV
jgi:ribosome recycling factor